MKKRKYLILTENNDNEGESWHFYLHHTPELEAFLREYTDGETYALTVASLDWETIDLLPANTTYMDTHNLVGDINLDKLKAADWPEDPLYKGGIQQYKEAA